MLGGLTAATKLWERANPRIRFRFLGLTDAPAGVVDGRNVIGFGVPALPLARPRPRRVIRTGRS